MISVICLMLMLARRGQNPVLLVYYMPICHKLVVSCAVQLYGPACHLVQNKTPAHISTTHKTSTRSCCWCGSCPDSMLYLNTTHVYDPANTVGWSVALADKTRPGSHALASSDLSSGQHIPLYKWADVLVRCLMRLWGRQGAAGSLGWGWWGGCLKLVRQGGLCCRMRPARSRCLLPSG